MRRGEKDYLPFYAPATGIFHLSRPNWNVSGNFDFGLISQLLE
jgi:hypothetical protein